MDLWAVCIILFEPRRFFVFRRASHYIVSCVQSDQTNTLQLPIYYFVIIAGTVHEKIHLNLFMVIFEISIELVSKQIKTKDKQSYFLF